MNPLRSFLSALLLLFDFSNAAAAGIPNRELLPLYLLTSPTVQSVGNIWNKWATVITGLDASMNLSKCWENKSSLTFSISENKRLRGSFRKWGRRAGAIPVCL